MTLCPKREQAARIIRAHRSMSVVVGEIAWAANAILDDLEALEKERQAELDAVIEGPETEAG